MADWKNRLLTRAKDTAIRIQMRVGIHIENRIKLNNCLITNIRDETFAFITEKHKAPESIETILLDSCEVTSIPISLRYFQNLVSLRITNSKLNSIPACVFVLGSLRELNLTNNYIRKLPQLLGYVKCLESLELDHNFIEMLPTSLIRLQHITLISVKENPMESPPAAICDLGTDAILECLISRGNRCDLWKGWEIGGSVEQSRIRTLVEMCVDIIVDTGVDYVNGPWPPAMKEYLSQSEAEINRTIILSKCSKCKKYFSNRNCFINHDCSTSHMLKEKGERMGHT